MKRRYSLSFGSRNAAADNDSNSSGSRDSSEGWAQSQEMTERAVTWRVKTASKQRAATKAAKAATDVTGRTNPKTGKLRDENGKE